ncbi:MAG: nitroreductase family protein [Deltaproteobacteria bacterium]|nr:nitroreductase family protein [Deltaproteobacteria bacterium]
MKDMMSMIKGRRSIRSYQDKDIPEEFLEKVLESIQWSPSWANTQCWEVIIVKDQKIKEGLQETLPKMNPARKAIEQAPVTIVLCGKLESSGYYKGQVTTRLGDWYMFDLGIATQSICLTAHSLGLGTVITGMFDHGKAQELLHVRDGYQLVSLIPIGYPAKEAPAPKRREISEFVHYETF